MMQVSGTGDGTVNYNGSAGSMPIDSLVKFWVEKNGCNPTAAFSNVPNISTSDGCTAEHYVYSGGLSGSSVELYKVIGGGHTWPGSPYIIGTTNQDFNASKEIWRFFRKYKLNTLTSLEGHSGDLHVLLYPNPANGVLYVQADQLTNIVITDMSGRVVLSSGSAALDISALSAGPYLVKVETVKGVKTCKLLKAE
jgi:polyhydroxybutyrate depolymerase